MLLNTGFLGKGSKKNNQQNEDTTCRKEKIFANNTDDKELMLRVRTKLKKLNSEKNNPLKMSNT